MEVIAMGEMRAYLQSRLPNFEDPVIFISSDFIPGCPKCNSSATVYYIKLVERKTIDLSQNIEKVDKHKFPIDIFIKYPVVKGMPQKIVIGTKKQNGDLQMIIRRLIE
ncbi:MAG: hypothetical protein ACOC44_01485 [Promethearchaeia archaeon]